jgi:hypothetical protein
MIALMFSRSLIHLNYEEREGQSDPRTSVVYLSLSYFVC